MCVELCVREDDIALILDHLMATVTNPEISQELSLQCGYKLN